MDEKKAEETVKEFFKKMGSAYGGDPFGLHNAEFINSLMNNGPLIMPLGKPEPMPENFGLTTEKPPESEWEHERRQLNDEIRDLNVRLGRAMDNLHQIMERERSYQREISRLKLQLEEAIKIIHEGNVLPTWMKKFLAFMIFACHPDRNPGRQVEATEVLKELLKLRGKI